MIGNRVALVQRRVEEGKQLYRVECTFHDASNGRLVKAAGCDTLADPGFKGGFRMCTATASLMNAVAAVSSRVV